MFYWIKRWLPLHDFIYIGIRPFLFSQEAVFACSKCREYRYFNIPYGHKHPVYAPKWCKGRGKYEDELLSLEDDFEI